MLFKFSSASYSATEESANWKLVRILIKLSKSAKKERKKRKTFSKDLLTSVTSVRTFHLRCFISMHAQVRVYVVELHASLCVQVWPKKSQSARETRQGVEQGSPTQSWDAAVIHFGVNHIQTVHG